MFQIIFGVFLVLHGLVHVLYFGHSRRIFELQHGMVWPDGSWTFSRLLGTEATRDLASVLLIMAAIGFITGGAGTLLNQSWWPPVVLGSAVFSTLIYIFLWDGALQALADKGGVCILLNAAILMMALVL
jgi:hypothetical protein